MLFMKGSPAEPRCGFSKKIVALLQKKECQFGSFDILTDEEVRQTLKKVSNWPTYPQLYVDGELVGVGYRRRIGAVRGVVRNGRGERGAIGTRVELLPFTPILALVRLGAHPCLFRLKKKLGASPPKKNTRPSFVHRFTWALSEPGRRGLPGIKTSPPCPWDLPLSSSLP